MGAASRDRWDDGNAVTVLERGRFLLHVTDVFIVEVDIHKGTQLAVVSVKVPAKIGMLRHHRVQRLTHGSGLHFHRRLLAHVLPQRRWDMDFAHT